MADANPQTGREIANTSASSMLAGIDDPTVGDNSVTGSYTNVSEAVSLVESRQSATLAPFAPFHTQPLWLRTLCSRSLSKYNGGSGVHRFRSRPRRSILLTEKEVARSWGRIFHGSKVEAISFDRAELLLEELRAESPLRHRLSLELEELRKLYSKQMGVVSQNA